MSFLSILQKMQLMEKEESINQLKAEAERLQNQLSQYQQELRLLQQKIFSLEHPGKTVITTPHTTNRNIKQDISFENFIGLRLIHLVGIVILVIGLSIGVKYAIDKNLISEGMRIALAYVAGVVLYILSAWLRKKYNSFSAILFSGAMASLYFTSYAAFVYYGMFSFAVAFILMVALTFYTVYEAIRYNRQEIALLGLVGAYAIPFLISRNNDRAELYFLYISIINVAVIFLSVRKKWKTVGLTAQVITWILFIGWAALRFDKSLQWVGLLFMSFFFCLFLLNSLSERIFYKKKLSAAESYAVVINNLALYIAALFVMGYAFADTDISCITFIISVLAFLEALLIHLVWKEEGFLKKSLAALFLFLFILFIAFKWEGVTVTLLWLLTAVLVFGSGVYLKSVSIRMAAILIMGLTLLKLLILDSQSFSAVQKIIAYVVLGVLLLVVSFFYQKFKKQLFGELDDAHATDNTKA
jgi:uncharacterized membrane protein